uniref:SMP-LTD domain-containing protein n=1 Tax=Parastrongyloides trichosuri TaxID=131310 RepID=A0A0N4Z0V4_PARTI
MEDKFLVKEEIYNNTVDGSQLSFDESSKELDSRTSQVMLSNYRLQTHVTVKKFKELYLAGELNDEMLNDKKKCLFFKENHVSLNKNSNSKNDNSQGKNMIKLPCRKKLQAASQDKFEMAKFSAGLINFNALAYTSTTNSCYIHNEIGEGLLKFVIPFIPLQHSQNVKATSTSEHEVYEIELKIPYNAVKRLYPDSTKIKLELFSPINPEWIILIEDYGELIDYQNDFLDDHLKFYLNQIREIFTNVNNLDFTLMKAHMVWMNYLLKSSFTFLQRVINMESNNKNEIRKFLKTSLQGYSPARRVTKSVTKFQDGMSFFPSLDGRRSSHLYNKNCFNVRIFKNIEYQNGKEYRILIENNNSYIDVTFEVMSNFLQLKDIDGIPLKIRFDENAILT